MRPAKQLLTVSCCTSCWLLLLLLAWIAAINASGSEAEKLSLDPAAVRDAIADLLRQRAAGGGDADHGDAEDDGGGYAEAAQEYLEHVQAALANVKSPTEVYIREQLTDLDTLGSLLGGLEATGGRPLTSSAIARLVGQLVKGPARQLLLLQLPPPHQIAGFAESELARRLTVASEELRRFLADVQEDAATSSSTTTSVTDRLRRHSDGLPAGPARDYLDAVLDRLVELEGKKAKFTVEYVDGEPKVTRVPDDDEDNKPAESSTSSADDADGPGLFDQVLRRLAAASVAGRLQPPADGAAGGDALQRRVTAAIARVRELRDRRYRPAGLDVILETIEQCLEQPK